MSEQTVRQRRAAELVRQIRPLLAELATLEPDDVVSVFLTLPVPLAGHLVEMSIRKKMPLPPLYITALLEGLLHMAQHRNETADVQRVARLIRHCMEDDAAWTLFCTHHADLLPREGGET